MRLIDADALERIYEVWLKEIGPCADYYAEAQAIGDCIEQLHDAPTIEAEPVRHGYWKNRCVCSECGRAYGPKNVGQMPHYNYCPNCGAKMGGAEDG